jgi:hypothetical protein
VAAVAIVGAGLIVADRGSSSDPLKRGSLPADLAAERLFVAEPNRTGIYRAGGALISPAGGVTGAGYPSRPLVSGQGLVVYIHDGQAYRLPVSGATHPQRIGAADAIFPVEGGAIGLEAGGHLYPGLVEYMAADGTVAESGTGSTQLPAGATALARLSDGLLIQSAPDPTTGVFQVSLVGAHATAVLGSATAVIGTHGTAVAWTSCPIGPTACSLLLVDTATAARQVIAPPAGYRGFAEGGGFSPDGSLLAAFVPASNASGQPSLRLVVIRTTSGAATIVGPPLTVGESIGSAAWSADGHWLYFGGLTGALYAEHTTTSGPLGNPWTLPVPTSYAIAGL